MFSDIISNKEFMNAFEKIISFNSVEGEPKKDMPFGEEVFNALNYFLNLAKGMGFTVKNYDNYIGEIVYGEGEEVGIIGHLDIVPAGDGWDTDPFKLTIKDGKIFGRGVLDDKGPLLVCLFVLKELKESGIKCNKKFRLIVGTNEETGWQDVAHFNKVSKFPTYGFSPDGDFPVIYAEKGVLVIEFKLPKLKNFYGIKGGTVINAVCGKAEVMAKEEGINKELLQKHGLILEGNKIISIGKSAHGSQPQRGVNALKALYEYFTDMGEDTKQILECLFYDKYKIMETENEQGIITFSPDLIEEKEDYISIKCDCRVPAPFTFDMAKKLFAQFGLPFVTGLEKHEPFLVEKDGEFVQTMLRSYNEITGENAQPLSMCGSTFARVFEKGCAFGPEFSGVMGSIHEPNENVEIELLEKMYRIYKKAIFDLAK